MCSTRPAAQQGSCLPQRQPCHSSYICLTFYIHTLGNDDYFWTAKYYLKDRQIIYHAFQSGRLLWFPTARTKFASLGYLTISSTKPTGSIREADCPLITAITALPLWKPFFSFNSFWKGCSSARGLKYPNASCSGLCTNHPVHTIAHYQWAYSNCAAPTQVCKKIKYSKITLCSPVTTEVFQTVLSEENGHCPQTAPYRVINKTRPPPNLNRLISNQKSLVSAFPVQEFTLCSESSWHYSSQESSFNLLKVAGNI